MGSSPSRSTSDRGLHGAQAFWLAIGIAAFVHFVAGWLGPAGWIARPFVWFSILVHELGHGVTAMLLGCDFVEFRMWPTGGVALHGGGGALANAAISAGGLLGPSIVAAICFASASSARRARIALLAIALFFAWALVFKVRTAFGVGFVAGVVVVIGAVARLGTPRAAQLALMFLGVQLAASLWSHLDYMFSAVARTPGGEMASDSAQIGQAIGGPYWLWGGLCALLSLLALALGAWQVLRQPRAAGATT
jgi:hypothetical protein